MIGKLLKKLMVAIQNSMHYGLIISILISTLCCTSCRTGTIKIPCYKNVEDLDEAGWRKIEKAKHEAETRIPIITDSVIIKYLKMSSLNDRIDFTSFNRESKLDINSSIGAKENGKTVFYRVFNFEIKVIHIEDLYKYYILSCLTRDKKQIVLVVPKEYGTLKLQVGHRYKISAPELRFTTVRREARCVAHTLGEDDAITVDYDIRFFFPGHYLYLNNAIPLK